MLLTLYNITMGSGSPTSLPAIAGGSTFLQPGGAGTVTTLTAPFTASPFLPSPKAEPVVREVLDISSSAGTPSPAATGSLLVVAFGAGSSGGADWTLPTVAEAVHTAGAYGIVFKPGSTQAIDDLPLGSGVGAEVVIAGPVQALCVAPSAGGAIVAGTLLCSDGNGNLQPFQPPSSSPTPTVTPVGTTGSTSYSYKLASVSPNGTYAALGTAGTTATGNATLTGANSNLITWTPVADASGYVIVRSAGGATQGTIGQVGQGVSSFSDTGLAALTGTSATNPYPAPAAGPTPTVTQVAGATAGTTTWTYTIASIAANGVWGAAGTAGSITTGAATLSAAQGNKITCTPVAGIGSYAIARTVAGSSPSSTGLIGIASPGTVTSGFIDYGIAATTYTQVTTPTNPSPATGTVVARSLGALASGTSTPALVPVWVGNA